MAVYDECVHTESHTAYFAVALKLSLSQVNIADKGCIASKGNKLNMSFNLSPPPSQLSVCYSHTHGENQLNQHAFSPLQEKKKHTYEKGSQSSIA